MASDANWAIVVGALYPAKGYKGFAREIVADLGGGLYRIQHVNTDTKERFGPMDVTEIVIRELSLPEDQSPLPKLYAALENLVEMLAGQQEDTDTIDNTFGVSGLGAELNHSRALLSQRNS